MAMEAASRPQVRAHSRASDAFKPAFDRLIDALQAHASSLPEEAARKEPMVRATMMTLGKISETLSGFNGDVGYAFSIEQSNAIFAYGYDGNVSARMFAVIRLKDGSYSWYVVRYDADEVKMYQDRDEVLHKLIAGGALDHDTVERKLSELSPGSAPAS